MVDIFLYIPPLYTPLSRTHAHASFVLISLNLYLHCLEIRHDPLIGLFAFRLSTEGHKAGVEPIYRRISIPGACL